MITYSAKNLGEIAAAFERMANENDAHAKRTEVKNLRATYSGQATAYRNAAEILRATEITLKCDDKPEEIK